MKTLSGLIILLFAKAVVSSQRMTLSVNSVSDQIFDVKLSGFDSCHLNTIDIGSEAKQYESSVLCATETSMIPAYFTFDYDVGTQSFTSVYDSFGNKGTCQSAYADSLSSFDCTLSTADTFTSLFASKCDNERQKCIQVCDKGSRSPACYRNCTALYNKCKSSSSHSIDDLAAALTSNQCNNERQKCIKICDKGSRSPTCYRNCTALFKQCKETVCNSERQKCIKVCDKGSKSPACYRNCTALYNDCLEKDASLNLTDACDTDRQKCIQVCDKGSRSPACYRNCTALYNDCKDKKPVSCDTDRQKCIKVCENGSKSPACYRNCTALFNQCQNKRNFKQAFLSIPK